MGTILVVEDEPDITGLVKYHLEKAGLPARNHWNLVTDRRRGSGEIGAALRAAL